MMLDAAIGSKSTQRISLQQQAEALALCTWPAELKPQAEALYRTGRAQRLIDLVAEHPGAWQARPNVHLAFWNAPVAQRLYLHCHLQITEHIHGWSGNDLDQIGQFYGRELLTWIFDATGPARSGRLELRARRNRRGVRYTSFRWRHPRKSLAACTAQVLLDLGGGCLLDLQKIHTYAPCGGWGFLVSADDVRAWLRGDSSQAGAA